MKRAPSIRAQSAGRARRASRGSPSPPPGRPPTSRVRGPGCPGSRVRFARRSRNEGRKPAPGRACGVGSRARFGALPVAALRAARRTAVGRRRGDGCWSSRSVGLGSRQGAGCGLESPAPQFARVRTCDLVAHPLRGRRGGRRAGGVASLGGTPFVHRASPGRFWSCA
jgi:hypothetical protein